MIKIEEIKRIREKNGMTQTELAKRAGVTQAHIAKIEAGKVDPRYSTIGKIFDELLKNEKETCIKYASRKIFSVKPGDDLQSVAKIMRSKDVSQLPVIVSNKVLGIISEDELLFSKKKLTETKVKEVMKPAPPLVPAETSLDIVKELFLEYSAVIVVEKGVPVGIITKTDLLNKK